MTPAPIALAIARLVAYAVLQKQYIMDFANAPTLVSSELLQKEENKMRNFSTWLVVMFMAMFWVFRVIVALMAQLGKDFGGFNYADETCIIRWLHRGNIIYDVEVPNDADNIKIEGATTIYRCNKIILNNPREVNDEMALDFYKKSNIPENSYYRALGAVSLMNYKNTALTIFKDKINNNSIDIALQEWNDFINNGGDGNRLDSTETVVLIAKMLNEFKKDTLNNK